MKLYLLPETESLLREAISQDNPDQFRSLASSLEWGKPSWSASQLLILVLGDDAERLSRWAYELSRHEDPFTRRYAPKLLLKLWEKDRERAERSLTALADDEHWLVREGAHSTWADLLKENFEQVYPILQGWSTHPSPNLRRSVAIAARAVGNLRKQEWAELLVQLLEPLLPDRTAYVRKNLGSYALGDGLLRCYPETTLKHLRAWALRRDEGTLWNVAMAFASYGGERNWQEGMKTLSELATDERRYVWRSVASALV